MQPIILQTPTARAELFANGAHLARFEAQNEPLLFLSRASAFESGQPIRGGVPICFPWFGPNASAPQQPAHGFARILPWEVERGDDSALFRLASSDATRALWPHEFAATYRVEALERGFRLVFEVANRDADAFTFEVALHTYFAVADARQVSIAGLDGKTYIDKMDALARKTQRGDISFEGETDRVYLDAGGPVTLRDGARTVRIAGDAGWKSTVVWNPWIAKARALKDLGDEEWTEFVCIESGAVADDAITLAAGQSYRLAIDVEASS